MKAYEKLREYGLTDETIKEFEGKYGEKRLFLGRIVIEHKKYYKVVSLKGEMDGTVSGKMIYEAGGRKDFPAVGDWVAIDRLDNEEGAGIISGVLGRKSCFTRKIAGKTSDEQIVAANIDVVFICMSLNNDYNKKRLERYLSIAWDSGATPVVILTKADLCADSEAKLLEIEGMAMGVETILLSAVTKQGVDRIWKLMKPQETVAFIGSSGVGKSTLINTLTGQERQKVNDLRSDHKGKHTTTYRELILLPNGAIVIDTPGMRELQLAHGDLDAAFADIEELARHCFYDDCKHESEPKCAVRKAIEEKAITQERLDNYNKLKKEIEYNEDRETMSSKMLEKKKIIKMVGSLDGMKKYKKTKR